MIYHGNINADFVTTDPNKLEGKLLVTNSILVNEGKRVALDSLSLIAKNNNDSQSLSLSAPFFSAAINGKYTLTQLGDVFQRLIRTFPFPLRKTK